MTKKIFKSIMLVSALVIALGLAFVMGILYRYFGQQMKIELKKEALYISKGVELEGVEYLNSIRDQAARITYIAEDGTVIFDSAADVEYMDNHIHREEVQEAIRNGSGESVRYSRTLSEKTIYYAMRLHDGTVLRISSTQSSVLYLTKEMLLPICWILFMMIILSGVFAVMISKKIVEPLNTLDLDNPEENQAYEEVDPLLSKIYQQKRQLTTQIEEVRYQQEEFSIITQNMQEGILLIDRYTMILFGNASLWNLFKVSSPKIGESVYALNRSEEFRNLMGDVVKGIHKDTFLKLNGNNIQVIANPVVRNNVTEGAVVLFVDVTEKVERANLRREFSKNVSYELKTPLTAISELASIIQDGYVKEEEMKTFAGRIDKEAQRMIQLVDDILRISRLDEETVSYEKETVNVYDLIKEVFGQLHEKAKQSDVYLYIGGDRPRFECVRQILEEILYNLCDNAIKFNKSQGEVSFHLEDQKDEVKIIIKDTGIGIPKEDQERVFERFYRVDKSRSKEIEGTGLGLSIIKHGVAYLDGKIEMQSNYGIGTEFILTFPKK